MDTSFATVCSMLPYPLVESKPGLNPNNFAIQKAENGGFSLNIIPNNIFYLINPDPLSDAKNTRHIRVPVTAIECARSIVNDYVAALIAVEPPDRVPGLFAISGDWTDKKEFALKNAKEIARYRAAQIEWFKNLVLLADDIWSKSHSPASISDLQRDACRMLEYERDWLSPLPGELLTKCPICRSVINEGALKCVTCGTVLNKVEYEKALAGIK